MDFCGSISSQKCCAFTILRPSTIRPRSRLTFNVAGSSSDSARRTATTADQVNLLPYEHHDGHQHIVELTTDLHSGSGCCPGLAVIRAPVTWRSRFLKGAALQGFSRYFASFCSQEVVTSSESLSAVMRTLNTRTHFRCTLRELEYQQPKQAKTSNWQGQNSSTHPGHLTA